MGNDNLNNFIHCDKCGKKLIERRKNGIFHFLFGKTGDSKSAPPVDMFIQGNIKIKCLRRSCGHWQILSYLPNAFQSGNTESDCADKNFNEGGKI